MSSRAASSVRLSLANPSGLGLFGLAIVTFVASSQKLGLSDGLSFVIVYAIFLGATGQLVACILDFFHENIWGATVFGAFAFFWYALAGAGLAPTPPLLRLGLFAIAAVLILRALAFPLLRSVFPGNSELFWFVSSGLVGILGVLFLVGTLLAHSA